MGGGVPTGAAFPQAGHIFLLVPQNRPPAFTPQRQRAIVPRCRWGGDEGAAPIVTVQSPGMTLANVVTRFMALAIIPLPIP